jgi:hypothetical protein
LGRRGSAGQGYGSRRAKGGDAARRKELGGQLERLRELYVMGDLTKDEYEIRCQAIGEELERIGPPLDPQIERADAILRDFARFWEVEPKAAERRKLIASLFDRVWQDEGRIVAVKPREPFLRYFQLADEVAQLHTGVNGGSKGVGGQTRKTTCKPHGDAAGVNSGSDGGQTPDCHFADRDSLVARRPRDFRIMRSVAQIGWAGVACSSAEVWSGCRLVAPSPPRRDAEVLRSSAAPNSLASREQGELHKICMPQGTFLTLS